MAIEFLSGGDVGPALAQLMDEYDEFHWAVAWGTGNELTKRLLGRVSKFRAVTFGLAFSQTDPDLVKALIGVPGSFVVTAFPGGTYHPKVYAFRSGKKAAAIVGSANFTSGGLGRNHEASVLITGSDEEAPLSDVLAFTERSAKLGVGVTPDLETRYRLSCKLAARKPRLPRDPIAAVKQANVKGLMSPLVGMTWSQYVRKVRSSAQHDVGISLELLRTAQAWLAAAPSFADLTTPQRKALAGVIGETDRTINNELDQDWGWFGSMRGAGDFKNRVAENDASLARAVDSIPQKGDVTREHYDRFAGLFVQAFADSHRVGGVPTASRLLAMKRPDVFLCVSDPNLTAAAAEMGFAKSTLKLDNYWDRVVEVIQASEWYGADKPDSRDGPLWECRAAMLDAILYRPD